MSGKKSLKFRYFGMIAVLLMIIYGGMARTQINIDETKTIEYGDYWKISLTGMEAGDILNINIQVIGDGSVDAQLVKPSGYGDYSRAMRQERRGAFNYYVNYVNGSSVILESKTSSLTIPENGDYYLVIYNTNNAVEGANTVEAVDVHATITVAT